MAEPILKIQDLTVSYRQGKQWLDAVREFSLTMYAGRTYGLVGESGSGKTTLVLAVMRYLGPNGAVRGGKIELAGSDILALDEKEMRQVWGKVAAMVPQNPQSALNPSIRVGEQLAETLRRHTGLDRPEARRRALELLQMVRLADPERVAASYPHQISGGMQQRVMIAMALSTEPQLLILDEPTTSLDVTTQAVILDLVSDLIQERNTAALYVTHNLGVVSQVCDQVSVMYAGELVEEAPAGRLFQRPRHPYTQGLIDSVPRLGETKDRTSLRAIRGQIPALGERPAGCIFEPRCPLAIDICAVRPPLYASGEDRRSRCHRWAEAGVESGDISQAFAGEPLARSQPDGNRPPVLDLEAVRTYFPVSRSLREWLLRQPPRQVKAVDGVTLEIPRGKTLGLVGESGSGKTTLARTVMGLVKKTGGEIELDALPLPAGLPGRDLETLRKLQIVFQNPEEAFNPYLTVGEALRQPLMTLLGRTRAEADREVGRLLEAVRLPPAFAGRLPGQLSGGELQRVAIARAFASSPDLLIGDEPVSSLDVSVQASILNLLNELQADLGASLLFVSHNLAVVGYLADVIAVIYLGKLMEVAGAADLFEPPYHPYTEALLSAIPRLEAGVDREDSAPPENIRLDGEIPSPMNVPTGCPFHTRCPRCLGEICIQETPPWRVDPQTGKRVFCHIPLDELTAMQDRMVEMER